MTTALVVGGDQIEGIKLVLGSYGVNKINHWPGRKVGDGKKVIPNDTDMIVLVTDWISHNFTHKIKLTAAKRGVRIIYTSNGSGALKARLERMQSMSAMEDGCRKTIIHRSCLMSWLAQLKTATYRILQQI